jgi:predicted CDP-diglyceride synthetase/phosphatidate cytidylyltransferase
MAHFGLFVRVFLLSFHQFLKTLNVRACAKIVHFLIFWIFVPNLPRAQILGMDFGKAMGKGFVKLGQILL